MAAFIETHPRHQVSFDCVFMTPPGGSVVSAHTLAEVYSNLTGIPGKQRATPEQAMTCLGQVRERFYVVTLTEDDYVDTISDCMSRRMIGGVIYDALVAKCAVKAGVEVIYTWNVKDFIRLGPEVAGLVRTP